MLSRYSSPMILWSSQNSEFRARYAREDAGIQRYRVGTDTPRFFATSRGGTPLASNFLTYSILLSVIPLLRPPLRPNWRAVEFHSAVPTWGLETVDFSYI